MSYELFSKTANCILKGKKLAHLKPANRHKIKFNVFSSYQFQTYGFNDDGTKKSWPGLFEMRSQ